MIIEALVTTGLIALLLLLIFPRVEVIGFSMQPTLQDGQIVRACRIYKLREGDIYVYKTPRKVGEEIYVIKRLGAIAKKSPRGETLLYFFGDNPDQSFDSRQYGGVDPKRVVARVILYRKNGE